MSLRSEIEAWDGKSAGEIGRVYERHAGSRGFAGRLVRLLDEPALQVGATWLLKRWFEEGGAPEALASELYARAGGLVAWEARLHLLQCMPYVPAPRGRAGAVARFLDGCLADENKFVRAWAYSGYYELALAHPRYRAEAVALLADAMETETAASVRARVRRVLRRGFPGG